MSYSKFGDNMNIDKIGNFIKALRIENNLSQNDLSEMIHVTRQAISNWENGKALPDSYILIELSNIFGVSINEILSGEKNDNNSNLEEIALTLVDENNKRKNIIKRIITVFTSLLFLLTSIFLIYYFISNYNSIKVFKIKGKSDTFKTYNGIFVTTRQKSYIRIGDIKLINGHKDIMINKVTLYYINSNDKRIILFETNVEDLLIKNIEPYQEYYLNKNINQIINNMYLKIDYNNNECEHINLQLEEDFKNNFNIFKKKGTLKSAKNNDKTESIKEKDILIKDKIEQEIKQNNETLKLRIEDENNKQVDNLDENIDNTADNNIDYPNNDNNSEKIILEETKTVIEEETLDNQTDNIDDNPDKNEELNLCEKNNNSEPPDYDTIVDFIKSNGYSIGTTYVYENVVDNKYIMLTYQNDTISLDTMYDNIMESWEYKANERMDYYKYDNYQEIKSITIYISENDSMNSDIITEFYQNINSIIS